MNLRIDSRSVRLRLDADEARALKAAGELRERYALLGLDLMLRVTVAPLEGGIAITFADGEARVVVDGAALATAVARAPAKDAGVYSRTEQGIAQALEIDVFNAKKQSDRRTSKQGGSS